METELTKLQTRVEKGQLKDLEKIHQAIGRLRERFPRVARYYDIEVKQFSNQAPQIQWHRKEDKLTEEEALDGTYLLQTNRLDLSTEMIWKIYIMLTQVERAFQHLKSTLNLRPMFHQLEERCEAHIFVVVLAYHLLHSIETTLRNQGEYRLWSTIRDVLRTHQVNTIVLPATNGDVYEIRKPTVAEAEHEEIYRKLEIDPKVNRYPSSKKKYRK